MVSCGPGTNQPGGYLSRPACPAAARRSRDRHTSKARVALRELGSRRARRRAALAVRRIGWRRCQRAVMVERLDTGPQRRLQRIVGNAGVRSGGRVVRIALHGFTIELGQLRVQATVSGV